MNYSVLTIFPDMFHLFLQHGIIGKAVTKKQIDVTVLNIRDFATDKHQVTDDRPYGGGSGMVMKPEPLAGAIRAAKKASPTSKTVLLTPQGRRFDQTTARSYADCDGLILICGRYEGIDERIDLQFVDDEISIGDYVLMGGELPAMVIMESVARLIPGVLGGEDSAEKDTFSENLVEHAHYTRPYLFEGETVPDVLLSGNHKEIETWRLEMSLIRTFLKRPDLLKDKQLNTREIDILKKWCTDIENIIKAQSSRGTGSLSGCQ
jgi:tRNA (guanine37-N1)-methyltransferase